MGKYQNNPWLGLESYQENQIIYGRNREIEELSQCVLNNNETVLYGKSGIGKSSIINAGILPVARTNGYIPIVVRLDHSNKHSYIKQINDQICKFTTICNCSTNKDIDEQLLWEYFHTREFKLTANAESKSKLLIVFDQFEEIFTLQENAAVKNQFFKEIGDVLNDVMPKSLVVESKVEKSENTTQNTEETTQITGFASMTDLFSSIAAQVEDANNQHIEDNDIHFVFTLREDFLSEFEYYTTRIPSLKQHRYGLRPINEEQAAEIIMKPRPDLVDEGVARLIIETVTNRTDFTLGDEPEIDVDAAVLSLFLSQIYDKRETEQDVISIELVKTFGKDIIKDFYEESIDGLSYNQIDFLEEALLTGENRRDSRPRSDFKAGGFTEEELNRLIDEKKLLRQFHYGGYPRVEFIHDVLCDVVKEHKDERIFIKQQEEERLRLEKEKQEILIQEQAKREKIEREAEEEKRFLLRKQELQEEEKKLLLKQQEEERRRQEHEKEELQEKNKRYQKKVKRNRLFFWLAIILAAIASPFIYNYVFTPEQWQLILVEDQTVGSENYWKAEVSILSETADTLYPTQILDKAHFQTAYPTLRVGKVRVVVQFLAGNFNTIDTLMNMSDSLSIPISRAYGRKKYEGKVIYGQSPGQPLKNAVVIIGNQIAKTNHKGLFTVYVDQNDISADGTIIIVKNGYKLFNEKIEEGIPNYKLQPEDSKAFEKKLLAIEKLMADSSFVMTGQIAGSSCLLKGRIKQDSIYGYYYYDSSVKQEIDLKFAKILFSGKINSDKTFHLDCSDWVYNVEELNGRINEDNSWEGYWHSYSPNLQKFKFIVENQ